MSTRNPDVIVIGAGIVGAACADALAAAGLSVLVLEAGVVGGCATAAGMGHVVVMDDSGPQFALTKYSRDLWDALLQELPPDCEAQRCGTIWVAADAEELEGVRRKEASYRSGGVGVEALDPAALAAAEPGLRPGLAGGLRVAGDSVVYPPAVARWLLDRARGRGTEVRAGTAVTSIDGEGVRLADGTAVAAGRVVNAAGIAAGTLTPGLPVKARKGHLVITDRCPGFARHQLVELGYLKSAHSIAADSVAFNIQPRKTGQMLLGSSRQYGDGTEAVDHGILGRMVRRGCEYMPGLARLSAIRVWTGFRAATPDKLPLVGPLPGNDRIWLAAGHEGLGITTSLATGALLADLMTGRTPAIPAEPYRVEGRIPSGMQN
jgi:glycine/D-amino acid oxidase-like deaminating enzyme